MGNSRKLVACADMGPLILYLCLATSSPAADGQPGFPPPRMSASLTGYGTVATLYGGVSRDDNGDVSVCYRPATSGPCHFHQSVWMFLPGNKAAGVGECRSY